MRHPPLVLLTALFVIVTASARAQAGPTAPLDASDTAARCQHGAWASLAGNERPTIAFTTEDECISHALRGGTVVQLTGPTSHCALAQHWDGRSSLARVDLSGCALQAADLGGADLQEANLEDANLGGANLSGARLNDANLTRAHLEDARLSRTDLRAAILLLATGATFTETTIFDDTTCPDGSVSDANPARTCVGHEWPGHRT